MENIKQCIRSNLRFLELKDVNPGQYDEILELLANNDSIQKVSLKCVNIDNIPFPIKFLSNIKNIHTLIIMTRLNPICKELAEYL